MMWGIRYAPLPSRSVSMARVSSTFIAEFQAMLAMKRNSVSMA